jgi:hypothetical protein
MAAAKLETADHDSCTDSSPGATLPVAVPITARKRSKSMSRRIGQNGTVEVRNGPIAADGLKTLRVNRNGSSDLLSLAS